MREYFFQIADFVFSVHVSEAIQLPSLLSSFGAFQFHGYCPDDKMLFQLFVEDKKDFVPGVNIQLLEESVNDLGHIALFTDQKDYWTKIFYRQHGAVHWMQTDKKFAWAHVWIDRDDHYVGIVLSSMIRIVFSQAILFHKAVSVHASVVACAGSAYLFMGKSGIGKSTHAALWLSHIPDTTLINDDNPIIRIQNGTVVVYGSPWSGKTPCYRNVVYPLQGAVRLRQGAVNEFHQQFGMYAFAVLFPGCSFLRNDAILYNLLCDLLIEISEQIKIGILTCKPDSSAAYLCWYNLNNNNLAKLNEK